MSEQARWVEEQKGVAEALCLDLDGWVSELEQAATRRTELMAAVVGAATAKKKGLGVIRGLDPRQLAARARALLVGSASQIQHPVLAEAVRRGGEIPRTGRGRLSRDHTQVGAPTRGESSLGPSSQATTSDAPGGGD